MFIILNPLTISRTSEVGLPTENAEHEGESAMKTAGASNFSNKISIIFSSADSSW